MRKLLLILCCMSVLSIASASDGKEEKDTFSVQVLVVDAETEEPIPAAKVKIDQQKHQSYTGLDGLANFDNFQEGVYDIEVSFVSYEKQCLKAQMLDMKNHQLIVKL